VANHTSTVGGVDISEEAAKYVAEQQWEQQLAQTAEITRRVFPAATEIPVWLENDPEIANLKFLVFAVPARGMTTAQAIEAENTWARELALRLPSPFHYSFDLHFDWNR
jgi:hypothetical protein